MSLEEQRALDNGTFRLDPAALNLVDPNLGRTALRLLEGVDCDARVGVLRNPGGLFLSVRGRRGSPLSPKVRDQLTRLAARSGVKVLANGRIPYVFGPDGRTPLLMPNVMTYGPESETKVVEITARLRFPDAEVAKRAAEYVDGHAFRIRQSGSKLTVQFHAQKGAAADESEMFQAFAERFGGSYESLGYSYEVPGNA